MKKFFLIYVSSFIVAGVLAHWLIQANGRALQEEAAQQSAKVEAAKAAGVSLKLETVEHDGHKFILTQPSRYNERSIIHHPGCPCLKP